MQYPSIEHFDAKPLIKEEVNKSDYQSPPKPQPESLFNKWFVVEEGTISISQRNLTIISGFIVTGYLAIMLAWCCYDGEVSCEIWHLPDISELGKRHPWDRLYCLIMTFHCMTCLQGNIRAFYKLNYDNKDQGWNRTIYWIGFVGTFLLPPVGYLDKDMSPIIHPCLATGFFICLTAYCLFALGILI